MPDEIAHYCRDLPRTRTCACIWTARASPTPARASATATAPAPADITWRAGVDVLCFGGTKNGMAFGEAVVFFDRKLAEDFDYRCKQAGQLASKMRFLAAPWVGMIESGAWLDNAAHANACARRLADALGNLPNLRLAYPSEANAVFVQAPPPVLEAVRAKGWRFYSFIGGAAPVHVRLGRRPEAGRRAGGGFARGGVRARLGGAARRRCSRTRRARSSYFSACFSGGSGFTLTFMCSCRSTGGFTTTCSPPLRPSRSSTVAPKSR